MRSLALCNFRIGSLFVIGLFAGAVRAAGPIEELYGRHLTVMADFDSGDVRSSVNGLMGQNTGWTVGEGGLFGSKALVGGRFSYAVGGSRRAIFDTRKPLSVLFWIKLKQAYNPIPKKEPGATHFSALWSGSKRFLVFRQALLGWGHAPISAYYHDGGYVTRADDYAGTLKNFKPGQWHLVVAVSRPDGFEMSVDGRAFTKAMCTKRIGQAPQAIIFSAENMIMDDCAVLDFALSDGQVKELWDEYQARMKETPGADREVKVSLETCGAKGADAYEVAVRAKNVAEKPVALRFSARARPRDSQPAAKEEIFILRPNEERLLCLSGSALGDEPVCLDLGVGSEDGKTTYFSRRRVFTPHAPEPDWMRAPSAVSFRFGYYPYQNTIHAAVDVTGCDGFDRLTSLAFAVFPKGGEKAVAEKIFKADSSGRTEIFWSDVPELDGEYVCRVKGIGLDGVAAEETFLRRRFAWERNKFGLSDLVPAPFEKVKIAEVPAADVGGRPSAEKVSVVMREHIVDLKTRLWRQVTAHGKEILARPMVLVGNGGDGKSALRARSSWDVDGMCEWLLTLPPGRYEPMSLEIPLKKDVAWLYHACTDGLRFNPAGRIPSGKGRVWDSLSLKKNKIIGSYVPYLWVGGTLRGLAVFGENDKGWVLAQNTKIPCHEIIRESDGTVVVRLNLIQKTVDIVKPQTIRLAFMATPVKDMPENWRAKEYGAFLGSCWSWGAETACCSLEPFDGTDEFFRQMGAARRSGKMDTTYLKRAVESYPYRGKTFTPAWSNEVKNILNHFRHGLYHAQQAGDKGRLLFYTNARGVHYGDPLGQGRTFLNSWSRFEYRSREFGRNERRGYDLDPVESYRDYAAWWYRRMLSTGACDYLYWDDVYLTPVENLVETDAYRLPDGSIQPATGIFNMRALIRRAAVLQTELGKDPSGNWVHMTNTAIAPICSFAGVNYDMEDTSGNDPMQVKYPKDYLLACVIGRQFGNRVGVMGYFHPDTKKRGEWLHRTGAGVVLTHELRWNRSSGHKWEKYHKLLCDWGYRTAAVDVWNYWDEDVAYPLTVTGVENASIVMAKKAAGEAYVCISSFSPEDGSVTVAPDAVRLGLGAGWSATDAETGKAISTENGAFRLDIPRYDWRLVKMQRRELKE